MPDCLDCRCGAVLRFCRARHLKLATISNRSCSFPDHNHCRCILKFFMFPINLRSVYSTVPCVAPLFRDPWSSHHGHNLDSPFGHTIPVIPQYVQSRLTEFLACGWRCSVQPGLPVSMPNPCHANQPALARAGLLRGPRSFPYKSMPHSAERACFKQFISIEYARALPAWDLVLPRLRAQPPMRAVCTGINAQRLFLTWLTLKNDCTRAPAVQGGEQELCIQHRTLNLHQRHPEGSGNPAEGPIGDEAGDGSRQAVCQYADSPPSPSTHTRERMAVFL
jgi:hypothetical protein